MSTAWWRRVGAGVATGALLTLGACDAGPSAVEARGGSAERIERRPAAADDGAVYAERDGDARAERPRRRAEAAATYEGRPLWSSNRRYAAEENARRHFERNGRELGAKTYEDFLQKVHAFTAAPPRGAQTLTRPNGDVLIYDAKANLFAVVSKDGAPRTMFKPEDGAAYWERQKAREAEGGRAGRDRGVRSDGGDDA